MASTGNDHDLWGNNNDAYEKLMINGFPRISAESIVDTLDGLVPYSQAGTILDTGCGTGFATRYMIERYGEQLPYDTRILAADLSPGMVKSVEEIKRNKRDDKIWQRVETQVSSVEDMNQIDDNTVSHIIASLVMFFPETPEKAFKESYRILKSGGIIGMSSFKRNDFLALMNVLNEVIPEVDFRKMESPYWSTKDAIRRNLEIAGFRDIVIHEVDSVLEMTNKAEYLDFLLTPRNEKIAMLFKDHPQRREEGFRHISKYIEEKFPNEETPKFLTTMYITTARK